VYKRVLVVDFVSFMKSLVGLKAARLSGEGGRLGRGVGPGSAR
jgi:hypothetical protein